jgi:hypothetical protein
MLENRWAWGKIFLQVVFEQRAALMFIGIVVMSELEQLHQPEN